jgi:hypothetical protein
VVGCHDAAHCWVMTEATLLKSQRAHASIPARLSQRVVSLK